MSNTRNRARRSGPEYQRRQAMDAINRRATLAEQTTAIAQAVVRALVHEIVKLARGESLAELRIPDDAATILGTRGVDRIREIANRARLSVTRTRSGFMLAPMLPTDPAGPGPDTTSDGGAAVADHEPQE